MTGMRAAGSDRMGDPARIGNSVRMEGTAPTDAELRPEDFRFVERPDETSFHSYTVDDLHDKNKQNEN